MSQKSERLRKYEIELHDLEEWLKLGLVPKKDVDKHKDEITQLKERIEEEKQRLKMLKESGELEEINLPKKPQNARHAYQEPHSLPEMDMGDEGVSEGGFDMETESFDLDSSASDESEADEDDYQHEEEEEDPYSDRNRWRRGVLEDPDGNAW
jgi:hypothetical protein